MSKFLKSLQSFAHTTLGLVVVIILALWQLNIFSLISNIPALSLSVYGSWLSIAVIAFAIIWAQMKDKVLLSHGILFFIYSSALAVFVTTLFSNSPVNAFDGYNIISLFAMVYALAVAVGEFMVSKPQPAKVNFKSLFALLLFIGAYYFLYGFTDTFVVGLVVLGAVLLGSKIVALLFAAGYLIGPMFSSLDMIIFNLTNNFPFQVSLFFILAITLAALVFIVLDLIQSFTKNEL